VSFTDKARTSRRLERRLNVFRDWYNGERTHQALGGRTPEEVWAGVERPEPEAITARDPQPEITVKRTCFRGDHRLPVFNIRISQSA